MNIPKSYEALAADLASEKILSKTLQGQKEAYMKLADKGGLDLSESKAREDALREDLESIKASVDGYDSPEHAAQVADEMGYQCEALQQRLTVAERRESEAREELLDLSRKLDAFYSRSHGIKNLSAIEDANDKSKALQQRLTVAEQRAADLKKLLCDVINEAPTGFAALKVDLANRVNAELKPAAEPEHICEGCGSKGWTANCDQCVPY